MVCLFKNILINDKKKCNISKCLSVYCVHLHPAFKDLCLEWVSLCDERVIRFHVLHELRRDVSVDSPCKLHFTVTVKICCSSVMFL